MDIHDAFIVIHDNDCTYEHLSTERIVELIAKLDHLGVLRSKRSALADELAAREEVLRD